MAEQKPLATRPEWLPPNWIVLTLESGVPVHIEAARILYVCGSGICLEGQGGGGIQVREDTRQIFMAISNATAHLPPRGLH